MRMTDEELADLKQELEKWRSKATEYYSDRADLANALDCLWSNQNFNGLVKDTHTSLADPFDGASDQRVRWGDSIVLRVVSLLILALSRADISFRASSANGQETARHLSVLLQTMIEEMGSDWLRQWLLLAFWYTSETPGVAMMSVEWQSEPIQERESLDINTILALATDGTAQGIDALLSEINGVAEEVPQLAAFLQQNYNLDSKTIRRVRRELRDAGESEFVYVADVKEGPVLQALRFGDDFIIPDSCTDFRNASPWFRVEWVTKEELEARIENDDWNRDFVEDTLKYEAHAIFADGSTESDRRGLYQLVWAYVRRKDKSGITGRYVAVFSPGEGTAFGYRLVSGRRGEWPCVFFSREVRGAKLIDSRGISEIAAPAQGVAKTLRDTAADNGIVGGLPPIKAKGNNVRNMNYKPLEIIAMNVNEDAQFLNPPAYPATAMAEADRIRDELFDYFGFKTAKGDPEDNLQLRQCTVQWWLDQVRDVMVMMVNLARARASDAWLKRVTNSRDIFGLRREQISAPFRAGMTLSIDDLNSEHMIAKMQTLGQTISTLDRKRIVDTTPLVTLAMRRLFPDISEDALRTQQSGIDEESDAEAQNLVQIRAGIMPKMDTEGRWDYETRLAFYQNILQRNPAAFNDMSEDKRTMLQQWIQSLQQQAQQYGANAALGKTGVDGVESID